MPQDNTKAFLSAQQGEINAAVMYREFAKITKDESLKKIFLDAAADEGRHAKILSNYTNQTIQPQPAQAKLLSIAYRILPKKIIFFAMYKGEYAGGNGYKPYINDYPEFEQMMNDEYRHGDTFARLMKK